MPWLSLLLGLSQSKAKRSHHFFFSRGGKVAYIRGMLLISSKWMTNLAINWGVAHGLLLHIFVSEGGIEEAFTSSAVLMYSGK